MENLINKLRIISLKNPKDQLTGGDGFSVGRLAGFIGDLATGRIFEAQINPENISRKVNNQYCDPPTPGTRASELQFKRSTPEELNLKFTLDGTNAVMPGAIPEIDVVGAITGVLPPEAMIAYVSLKLAELRLATYDFLSDSHSPPYVLVLYGKTVFYGVLKTMTVNNTLFHATGVPLRAEVTMVIQENLESETVAAALSLLSPDLTRRRKVVAGDNILRLSDVVYESDRYYLELARVNRLSNFRKLRPGHELVFPPIDKVGA